MYALQGVLVGVAFGFVGFEPWLAVKIFALVGCIHILRGHYVSH